MSSFPHERMLPREAVTGRVSELALMEHLGSPTLESEPLGEDPMLFWDIQWDCGLLMSIEFHQLSEILHVTLDRPDFNHALRHIGATVDDLEMASSFETDDLDRPVPIDIALDWEVVCETGEGLSVMATGISEHDAMCLGRSLTDADKGDRNLVSVRRIQGMGT